MESTSKQNLEERLIAFAVQISKLAEALPNSLTGKYLAGQIIRSGFSPALNYGEARGAESSADFIHKMKIALKELRETFIALKILRECDLKGQGPPVNDCILECNELISIFVKSVQTAATNRKQKI
jgi:four helix bundle protein